MPDFLKDYFLGLADSLKTTLATPDAYLNKLVLTIVLLVIGSLLSFLLKKMIDWSTKDYTKQVQLHKSARQTILALLVFAFFFIWVQAINALILIALLLGGIAVFIFRGLASNIVGYFVIKYRKYIEVGHRIEINEIIGDVIGITPTHVKMLEVRGGLSADANTGRVIKLPNRIIFEESIEMIGVKNSFVWHELKYVLTFESDWEAAEKIMIDVGDSYFDEMVLSELEVDEDQLPKEQIGLRPVFSLDLNDIGLVLVLRYMVNYQNGTTVKTALQRKIIPQFMEHPNIAFAIVEVKVFQD